MSISRHETNDDAVDVVVVVGSIHPFMRYRSSAVPSLFFSFSFSSL